MRCFWQDIQGFAQPINDIRDPDDQDMHSDAVFAVKPSLIAKFKKTDDPERIAAEGVEGPFCEVSHDFDLVPMK
jgi:catechol 1,2-dioxygenase